MADLPGGLVGVFDRASESYDQVGVDFFRTFGRHLVADVALRPGDRVLDVGCGRGAVLLPAAEAVAPGGAVTGIDLAPGMVRGTGAEVERLGYEHVHVEQRDAQAPGLPPAAYDAVVSSLVLHLLPEPATALRAWHDLLVPGGRLGVTTFAGDDARWSWWREVFGPYLPQSWRSSGSDGPFASSESLAALLVECGFVEPVSVVRDHIVVFDDGAQWIAWSWSQGQRAAWESVPDAERPALTERALGRLQEIAEPDGRILLRQPVRYTRARRAS